MQKLTCSLPEAAEMLGISKSKIYPLARSEGFPVIVMGKRKVVSIKGLERWVEEQSGGNRNEK